jgi:hypothetical protein
MILKIYVSKLNFSFALMLLVVVINIIYFANSYSTLLCFLNLILSLLYKAEIQNREKYYIE